MAGRNPLIPKLEVAALLLSGLAVGLLNTHCATTPPPGPPPLPPEEPLSYSFAYTPPEQSASKLGIAIGIVDPQWPKDSFGIPTVFCVKEQEQVTLVNGKGTSSRGPIPQNIVTITNEFSSALARDYQAMLASRGFDISGPYKIVDDMTYPEKKACPLILVPECQLTMTTTNDNVTMDSITSTAVVRMEVVLAIYEPMSNQKLWIKRINVESEPFEFKYLFECKLLYDAAGNVTGKERVRVTWDNRAPRYAHALDKFYKEIMEQCWKYFSPEELTVLKGHSDQIRSQKVF